MAAQANVKSPVELGTAPSTAFDAVAGFTAQEWATAGPPVPELDNPIFLAAKAAWGGGRNLNRAELCKLLDEIFNLQRLADEITEVSPCTPTADKTF